MAPRGPVSPDLVARVRDSQERRITAALELWNVRLEHLRHTGSDQEVWDTVNGPILSAGDNCECNRGCNVPCGSNCGSLNTRLEEVGQPWST